MNRRLITASMSLALAFSATLPMVASPLAIHAPVNAFFGKEKDKTVSFSVRNDSKATIKLMAGATPMTVEPGKTVSAKLNVGEKVTYAEATGTRAAGDIVATASPQLVDATIAIR